MLSPSQQIVYQELLHLIPSNTITGLVCTSGCGLTTILSEVGKKTNAKMVRLADFFDEIQTFHPLQLEEAIANTLIQALKENDCIIVDDFSSVANIIQGCYQAARPKTLEPALDAALRWIEQENKRLILGLNSARVAAPFNKSCHLAVLSPMTDQDFAFLFQNISGKDLKNIDFEKVHRFAPRLSAFQMKRACAYLKERDCENTDAFVKFLESRALISNVNVGEVEEVSFNSLYGVSEVIRQLEINIINPLERDDLVKKLGLSPKRGVLLYGPPGTGKTTIGRALAHRLRSKFFLIDGTVISGTPRFYEIIHRIFESARQNAPCILFIDDCDLLFENEETGLYRYLLTMLDGLESKSNAQITIILTAMNIGSLPPALIRSGRIELWLEMKLPDATARAAILRAQLQGFPLELTDEEIQQIAEKTDQFTGADLRRLVTDAKNLYGYDVARENPLKGFNHYLETAIELLLQHRVQFESAPAFTSAHYAKSKYMNMMQKMLEQYGLKGDMVQDEY